MASPNRRHDKKSFFKYANASTAKTILGQRTLRWSSPILFNDPFDIPRKADLSFTAEQVIEACLTEFLETLKSDRTPGNPNFAAMKSEMQRRGIRPDQVIKVMKALSGAPR